MHKFSLFSANQTLSESVSGLDGRGEVRGRQMVCALDRFVKAKASTGVSPGGGAGDTGTLGYTDTWAGDTLIHRGAGWGMGVHWCVALAPLKTSGASGRRSWGHGGARGGGAPGLTQHHSQQEASDPYSSWKRTRAGRWRVADRCPPPPAPPPPTGYCSLRAGRGSDLNCWGGEGGVLG